MSVLVASSIALAGTVAAGAATSGSHQRVPSTTTVKPDFSYYAGKTITWDDPGAPGASFYITASILAPLVAQYLHATVNVESIPAGATITGQNVAAAAPNDGLTIGTINLSTDIYDFATHIPGINFSLEKQVLVAGLPINPDVLLTSPTSGFTTFASMAKAHAQFNALDYSGSIDMLEKTLFASYGVKAHLISGYSSVPLEVAGFLRGDAPVALNTIAGFSGAISAGQAIPLLQTTAPVSGGLDEAQLKNVPTLNEFVTKNPPKTADGKRGMALMEEVFGNKAANQVIFLPPKTNPAYAAALTAAFKSALNQAQVKAAFLAQALTPGFIEPATVEKSLRNLIAHDAFINSLIGSYSN